MADHVRRALAAWERHDKLRVLLEHFLIANRPSGATVLFPVGRTGLHLDPALFRPFVSKAVGTFGGAVNHEREAAGCVKPVQSFKEKLTVGKVATACDEHTHIQSPFAEPANEN